MIATYCKAKSINLTNIIQPKYQEIVQKKYGFKDWESVLAAIGHGGLRRTGSKPACRRVWKRSQTGNYG